jgi:hypothetical protein
MQGQSLAVACNHNRWAGTSHCPYDTGNDEKGNNKKHCKKCHLCHFLTIEFIFNKRVRYIFLGVLVATTFRS